MQTLGTPNTMKVYDKLNQRCIPNPWAITAHPAWNDPVKHPWTTGAALTYSTEAILWGSFIEQHLNEFPDGVKVGALVMNNDFGKIYDATFRDFLAESPNKDKIEYVTETIEPTAATVTNEMTTIAVEGTRRLHHDAGRYRLRADRRRGGPERDEGHGQVPLRRPALRQQRDHGQGQGRWRWFDRAKTGGWSAAARAT